MKTLFHSRWGFTLILAVAVLALALAGGTWGTSQAASPQEPQAVPTITSISPIRALYGTTPYVDVNIYGTNFGDSDHTRVRFYQWGDPEEAGSWQFTPLSFGPTTLVVRVPAWLMVHPNLFSVVVINYINGVPVDPPPTVPTVPTDVFQLPPDTPPVIDRDWPAYEELSNEALFRVYDFLFHYLPIISSPGIA